MEEKKDENKYAGLTAELATGEWCQTGIARAPERKVQHTLRRGAATRRAMEERKDEKKDAALTAALATGV